AARPLGEQRDLLQVAGRHAERDGVPDRLVEAVVGALAEQEGLPAVRALVDVVAQLVVDGDEVLARGLDAHLDAQVEVVGDGPGAGVADHVAVRGLAQQRPLPERLRQRLEARRGEEAFAVAHHLALVDLLRLQQRREVVAGPRAGYADQRVDIPPLLGPDAAGRGGGEDPLLRDLPRTGPGPAAATT